ncbi:ABC transporter ATP-binding protein [Sphaerospermopsis sp. FACHB-1094]|uniref:ABC transporter ATP-binding protein n=1 Tax=Sphaerospermopsis sp. FACHB-1094 TaxID=2692861 RepID=UPI001686E616|nr:ABC transporter ATP-binding protein [Sphaerospermopsis sp. FACHB-1094]MBD2131558.1 ABC transporter ATP-binding protein [Sphaerospermopsis sp. FACHB-1094]
MTEPTIKIHDLGKMYRLYQNPTDKVLDAFGINRWLFWRKQYYQEFWALRGLNLEVKKGERLGLIGRNGAGKSTLLKIITGNVAPTEGRVEVMGRVQALMELGTGFHPEFTGRQNIRASLAYQELSPAVIQDLEEEIIDFSELEEFIDQPIKTYSAGMYARLAFSTATSVQPEILIIDEILGAGDAYFAGKCVERMKKLTEQSGATVLFVSHDISSVEMLCDRCLWIERGTKKMEGETAQVSRKYAQMIRELTEQRLRTKNARLAVSSNQSTIKLRDKLLQFILRFIWIEGLPIEIISVKLSLPEQQPLIVKVGEPQDNSYEYDSFILIDKFSSLWGQPIRISDDTHSRPITINAGYGSAIVFNIGGISSPNTVEISIKGRGYKGSKAKLEIFDGYNYVLSKAIDISSIVDSFDSAIFELNECVDKHIINNFMKANDLAYTNFNSENSQYTTINQVKSHIEKNENIITDSSKAINENVKYIPPLNYSTDAEIFKGEVLLEKVSLTDDTGVEKSFFQSFQPLLINIEYLILAESIESEFVVCIHRYGIIALQALSGIQGGITAILKKGDRGRVTLRIPYLPLGKGSYLISIAVFPPLNYQSQDTERTAYILHDRKYEIVVEQPEKIAIDLGMCRADVEWIHNIY